MISNLQDYFKPELDIFLDTVSYKRIESECKEAKQEFTLLCQDNVKVSLISEGVRVIVTRSLVFDPEKIFSMSVSFGTDLKFNDKKSEYDWERVDLAEEFRENGDFVTAQLMSRISLIIGQITSSFGQQPLIIQPMLAKKTPSEN